MLEIDAFLQARHEVQRALNPCCRKVSAISNNNSSLNRSLGMQSTNECPCWGLEGHFYWVKFSRWVFPSFELLEVTAGKSKSVPVSVEVEDTASQLWALWAPTESCRLLSALVWSVQRLCPQPLLKATELLLPRLSWHCFSLLLALPDYLLHTAMCLPTCCESSVLHFCQHKEPASVNFCLPLNTWARFSLSPRTIYMFRHIAVFLKDILVQKKTWQI